MASSSLSSCSCSCSSSSFESFDVSRKNHHRKRRSTCARVRERFCFRAANIDTEREAFGILVVFRNHVFVSDFGFLIAPF